jgi:pyruvate/2-oxoglutarate dehydrogenase complex dihydrolipoamide acyltransferase (E2) component
MARVNVIMPQMGESIAEGTLSRSLARRFEPVRSLVEYPLEGDGA